eukprot:4171782-Alexandrium_andersonii.AAC.1
MFEDAYRASVDTVSREVKQCVRVYGLDVDSDDVFYSVSAGAYFQMYTGFLDLQFAIPLSEKGPLLR